MTDRDSRMSAEAILKCSFCGKNQEQVKNLIAGPGAYICDECVGLCDEIIAEEDQPPEIPPRARKLLEIIGDA